MTSNATTGSSTRLPSPRPSRPVAQASREERAAAGKAARGRAPLDSHAGLDLAASRDPVGLLLGQAASRVPELVPVRHGRMLVSPFTYFRGAALPMAADLAGTPASGLRVQLCGDAHLANFGAYASPERQLVFDLNDFDESLPGPFEWDVKRLAASLAVAGRDNGFGRKDRRKIVLAGASAYRTAMREFAKMPMLDVWYARLDVEQALARVKDQVKRRRLESTEAMVAKARTRDSTQAMAKLTTEVEGRRRITGDPPLIVPVEDLFPALETEALYAELRGLVTKYSKSLQTNRRHLLEQFDLVHMARKVVGVGSVGTRAWILLMEADDGAQPLFLQAKEAQVSVLADYVGRSRYANQGERVVAGQVLMQAVSDIFLGWQRTKGQDGIDRDFYVRQLRDWKLSATIETMLPGGMAAYASLCGWTLARAHARSGDRVAISAYLGRSDTFDVVMVEFAEAYADLNERDHAALADAVTTGRAQARSGL
jgi:uncharacterized protein (DUF2252 family)